MSGRPFRLVVPVVFIGVGSFWCCWSLRASGRGRDGPAERAARLAGSCARHGPVGGPVGTAVPLPGGRSRSRVPGPRGSGSSRCPLTSLSEGVEGGVGGAGGGLVLPGPAAGPLARDHHALQEQLAAPDSPGLAPLESTVEAQGLDGAA